DLGRVPMILPADQAGNTIALLHARAREDPVLGLEDDPIAAAIDWLDVSRTHEQPFVRSMLGERAVFLFSALGVVVITPVRATPKHDPVGPSVAAAAIGSDPADGVPREKEQVHASVAHPLDASELADIPVFVVADAHKCLALQSLIRC